MSEPLRARLKLPPSIAICLSDGGETWARDCGSLEEAFQAIRDEVRPRPDNVFHLSREDNGNG